MSQKPEMPEIRVINGALDETPLRGGTIILRGVVHHESLQHLRVDDYQRERKPASRLKSIWSALKAGESLPDIELGMRGERFHTAKDGTIYLQDPVFIIDGLQRQTAALNFLEHLPGDVRLGAVIHFSTNKAWERERFRVLNTTQGKVSGNVLLRNLRETNPAVLSLYGLCHNDADFPLRKRVCWSQNFNRTDLIGAVPLAKAAVDLHRHLMPRGVNNASASAVADWLGGLGREIGLQRMRANIAGFIGVIDEAWPIREIASSSPSPFLRSGFLTALSRVLSFHTDFWRDGDEELFIDTDLRRKIGRFPVFDPNIAHMTATGNTTAVSMLARHITDHINSGKRTKRLTSRMKIGAAAEPQPAEA